MLSVATAFVSLLTFAAAPVAVAQPAVPGYVDHVVWAKWGDLSSLRVYPTAAARQAARQAGTVAQADQAWSQVLAAAPDADIPGMREQFVCHWQYAELAQPGKTSWNLEPWRPEVDPTTMLAAGCNPGGTEEPF
ncbi:DUF2599 domain-containing protein [Mycolicibacterium sp. S2-37]|uniref:DUF2599 domain-containing protein n=1 Tax=Mycolicibacterium sp. S2-37 TaxID=2810297 RepID=UPI001A93D8AD|nr:DUF2599 domain-containing protein [Mycolicibacterium sp. S2-37]MBO0679294.1 DUF2599 domain-containing protein [Mycolicibacterium sp. S2-37]